MYFQSFYKLRVKLTVNCPRAHVITYIHCTLRATADKYHILLHLQFTLLFFNYLLDHSQERSLLCFPHGDIITKRSIIKGLCYFFWGGGGVCAFYSSHPTPFVVDILVHNIYRWSLLFHSTKTFLFIAKCYLFGHLCQMQPAICGLHLD